MSPAVLNCDTLLSNGHSNGIKKPDGFGTRAIHVGSEPNPETGAVIPSISLSTTYKQDRIGVHKGFEYSRSGNPNRNALEETLASIEAGGAYGIAFASGSSTTATVLQSLGPNAHIVAKINQGLDTTFVDLENADDQTVLAAFQPNTKLIWIETPTNPTLRLIDIPRVVALARSHPSNPLVLVDNTFLSPFYQSPLLQEHSALNEKLRFLQNAIGAVPSAYDSWLAQRGAKTLHLRMKAHGTNALAVAKALKKSPYVEEVIYPGLSSHPRNDLAYRSLSPHARKFVDQYINSQTDSDDFETGSFPYGGMISFRIRGGASEAEKFLTSTRLFTLAESLGGVESLAEHPAKMTHGSIPEAERALLGIGDNLIRLSVGVEEAEDLVADVEQALAAASGGISPASTESD
ncbi:trans-sulfuration enzymes family protein [Abortiporus biennis]